MQETIQSEMLKLSPGISWDDIIGLDDAKQTLTEMVVLPSLRPDLFTGIRSPPRGLLLFGPSGTGKTMIAKALATEAKARFFALSAAALTNKFVGESEKLCRALYAMAAALQPSIVFIDEIDSVLSARKDDENDASRRLKTEFLVQLDGMLSSSEDQVVTIGATNRPWDLDEAIIRRLPRRVYIPLPNRECRLALLSHLLQSVQPPPRLLARDFDALAERTEGFSNADMAQLAKDAALAPLREVSPSALAQLDSKDVRPVVIEDFAESLKRVRPTVSSDQLALLDRWNHEHGSFG